VVVGDTIVPVYSYRDAHGRGTNLVPARSRISIVGSSNLEDFECQYLAWRRRSNIIDVQFLNRDLDYEQDSLPIEDPDADINDPTLAVPDEVRRETVEMFGVTHPGQVVRETRLRHAISRLARKMIRFRCGIDQLGVQVGDVIGVQHDAFRPFGDREVYFSCRTGRSSLGVREIVLDRDLTITGGAHSVAVHLLTPAGSANASEWRIIADGNGTYPAGSVLTTAASQPVLTCDAETMCVVGEYDGSAVSPEESMASTVEDYVVVSATLDQDLRREVQALLWTPEAFDFDETPIGSAPLATTDMGASVEVVGASSLDLAAEAAPGTFRLSWRMPDGRASRRARVFARGSTGEPRVLVEEVVGDSAVLVLDPDAPVFLSVAPEDDDGVFQAPDLAEEVEFVPPEFAAADLEPVRELTADVTDGTVTLRWLAVRSPALDHYEIRMGDVWFGAVTVLQTTETVASIDDLPAGTHSFLVRAVYRGGVHSSTVASVSVTTTASDARVQLALEEFVSADGSHASTDVSDGVAIAAGQHLATWELAKAVELDEAATVRWHLAALLEQECLTPIASLPVTPLSDPEWDWSTVAGREPTRRYPGCADWSAVSTRTDLLAGAVDPVSGPASSPGSHAEAIVEASFDSGPWERFRPGLRRAQQLDLRVTLRRATLLDQVRVRRILLEVTT
jgi:hypothetical protein